MRPLLVAALLLPAAGLAQSGIVLTLNGAGTSGVLARNSSGCSTVVAGSWTGTGLTGACTPLQVWLTSSTSACGAAPSTTNSPADVIVYTTPAGTLTSGALTSATFNFNFTALPSFSISGNSCGSVVDFSNQLCAGLTLNDTTGQCNGTAVTSTPLQSIRYDNVPPAPPALAITPLDGQLSVRLSPSDPNDTILSYSVQYALAPPDGGTPNYVSGGSNIPANNPTVTISGLANGTTYLVLGYSVDEATNLSAASAPVAASPVLTLGFYANYINDGGKPAGGCGDASGGGPSALALVTVLLLGLVRRRG
jgi:hypothetical protein